MVLLAVTDAFFVTILVSTPFLSQLPRVVIDECSVVLLRSPI